MDYQFNKELEHAFESADFVSDDFENYGFDEYAESSYEEENYLNAAIKELDDSLGIIEVSH